ncbi:MAG: hypothetical protein H6817_03455 [Phycisphaerales bacterium]|nr:hypothetical protein [Phycisphaerales bacterium]
MTAGIMPFRRYRTSIAAAIAAAIVFASAGRAEITNVAATLEAATTEYVDGESASTDSSIEMFPETSPTLPAEALSGLGDFDGDQGLGHGVRSAAVFSDPTLSEEPNPMELGVEAVSFSDVSTIAYQGIASIVETRDVVLTAGDLNVNTSGESNLVISSAFLDGAIVVWTADPSRDLTGLSAEFEFAIVQDTSTGGEITVFESVVAVTGEPDGEVHLVNSSVLQVNLGGPELVQGATDSETQDLIDVLNDSGRVHIALVPTQQVQYAYFANADEPFTLRAEVSCRSLNLPNGTGAAAVFGQDFASLAPALEPFLTEAKATEVQEAINRAFRTSADEEPSSPIGALCGAFGMEAMLVTLAGLMSLRRSRVRMPNRA